MSVPRHLSADAAQAVHEPERMGLYMHCISPDPKADPHVGRIFGTPWTVIDRMEQQPRRLPRLLPSSMR